MFGWLNPFRQRMTVTQFHGWEAQSKHTPDVPYLEHHRFVPLLEYGDAMRDQRMHSLIQDHSFFHAHAFTATTGYIMRSNEGQYPLAFELTKRARLRNGSKAARIRGELLHVEADGIIKLDNYRQNGVLFRRARVRIDIPHREEMKVIDLPTGSYRQFLTGRQHYKSLTAFIYLAQSNFWEPKLDGGYSYPFCKRIEPPVEGKNKSVPFFTFNEVKARK